MASFELHRFRLWIDEYSALASRGAEIGGIATAERAVETPAGPVATRLYNPDGQDATLVFVHGGGWVMGGVKTHDHIARWLASETGSRVLQLEYSLAPERPYPAAVNEVMGVVSATLAEARAAPVLVAGDFCGRQSRGLRHSRAVKRREAPDRRLRLDLRRLCAGNEPFLASALRRRTVRTVRSANALVLEPLCAPARARGSREEAQSAGRGLVGFSADALHRRRMRPAAGRHARLLRGAYQSGRRRVAVALVRACRTAACTSSARSEA